MRRLSRNLIAWLQGFIPMWQMKFRDRFKGELKCFDASEGIDWWLPRLKKRISVHNEEVGNPKGDSSQDAYAWYERIQ
jgi:hypothetical protein